MKSRGRSQAATRANALGELPEPRFFRPAWEQGYFEARDLRDGEGDLVFIPPRSDWGRAEVLDYIDGALYYFALAGI